MRFLNRKQDNTFVELLERANNGDTEAMGDVAEAYCDGDGVEKDLKKAQEWYAKRFAILLKKAEEEEEDIDAMEDLARAYEKGLGVEKDLKKAQYWRAKQFSIVLERAHDGDREAMWQVACAYRYGGFGMEKNEAKAREWYARAKENE